MNCLIIFSSEIAAPNRAILTGARAAYAIEKHGVRAGLTLRAGEAGGRLGKALVLKASPDEVELQVEFNEQPPTRAGAELIAAVPRPQTIKKLLQMAAAGGVDAVHFLRSDNVVKSYLQSKSLHAENVQAETLKGLEQGVDTVPPSIEVWRSLAALLEKKEQRWRESGPLLLLADTSLPQMQLSPPMLRFPDQHVIFAVGPESGWSERERRQFKNCGFQMVSLGARMQRVEVAAAMLLGQLCLLRGQHKLGER